MDPGKSGEREDAAGKLLELEILIGDDLRMITRDLLPVLKKMRKAAYSRGEEKRPIR
jgi:hypothetical protein